MPTGIKIALFGTERIRNLMTAGTCHLQMYGEHEVNKSFESALSVLSETIKKENNTTLVDSYRKVQHKYHPEKDILVLSKRVKNNIYKMEINTL